MYSYKSSRNVGAGSIFFIVLFILVLIGSGYLFYSDKGKFWDFLPIICIASVVINLILLIFYFIRRSGSGYIFLLFFLIFLAGIILSSFFGPFALYNSGMDNFDNKKYREAAVNFKNILDEYPNSKYADDSLKKIAQSFYLNGDYKEAVFYYEEAIDKKIIDDKSLEVKKIFADCFLKMAERNYDTNDYTGAADNYLKCVEYLMDITLNYPDTNEAFIAKYKIPEYLFEAASNFSRGKEWEKSQEILQNIIDNYPESEYWSKSNELLFNILIGSANELKNDKKYKEAVFEFLNVFNLQEDIKNSKKYEINYQKEIIFSNIPPYILIQVANEEYSKNDYETALFIYDYILKEFPENEASILVNVVNCKIKITVASTYESITATKPTGIFSKSGLSKITFENKTAYNLTLFIGGPDYNIIRLEKETKLEVELKSGTYKIVAELQGSGVNPFYGEITYEDGKKYREIYKLEEEKE
jgi:TolA-binding protein